MRNVRCCWYTVGWLVCICAELSDVIIDDVIQPYGWMMCEKLCRRRVDCVSYLFDPLALACAFNTPYSTQKSTFVGDQRYTIAKSSKWPKEAKCKKSEVIFKTKFSGFKCITVNEVSKRSIIPALKRNLPKILKIITILRSKDNVSIVIYPHRTNLSTSEIRSSCMASISDTKKKIHLNTLEKYSNMPISSGVLDNKQGIKIRKDSTLYFQISTPRYKEYMLLVYRTQTYRGSVFSSLYDVNTPGDIGKPYILECGQMKSPESFNRIFRGNISENELIKTFGSHDNWFLRFTCG